MPKNLVFGQAEGGQAHVVALLSPVAGIPLAAAVKFSRSGNLWNRFVAIKITSRNLNECDSN